MSGQGSQGLEVKLAQPDQDIADLGPTYPILGISDNYVTTFH